MSLFEVAYQLVFGIGFVGIGINTLHQQRFVFRFGIGRGFPITITGLSARIAGAMLTSSGVILTGWTVYMLTEGSKHPDLVALDNLPFFMGLFGTIGLLFIAVIFVFLIEGATALGKDIGQRRNGQQLDEKTPFS